jgi:hypothetical protein
VTDDAEDVEDVEDGEKRLSDMRTTHLSLYLRPFVSWPFSHTHRLWLIANSSVQGRLSSQSGHIRVVGSASL